MNKNILFFKVAIFLIFVLLSQLLSFKVSSQNQQSTLIYSTAGVSNFNSGDFFKPYFCNELGLLRINEMSKYTGFSFGIIFKQTRGKTIFFNDTKSYISYPLYFNLSIRQLVIQTGITFDMYAFRHINYTNIANKTNDIYPYLLNFRSPSLSQANNGVLTLPFSFGYVANASYLFKSNRFGLLLSFQMNEIISLYGRNFNFNENNEKSFYYPSSFSIGFLYKLN